MTAGEFLLAFVGAVIAYGLMLGFAVAVIVLSLRLLGVAI